VKVAASPFDVSLAKEFYPHEEKVHHGGRSNGVSPLAFPIRPRGIALLRQ
jgi:hypothetical protein